MPTRLVVWNINRFSNNTLNDSSGKDFVEKFASIAQSVWNGGYIRNIAKTADIFVILEVQSSRDVLGSLVGGLGQQGVLFLLDWMKLNYNANWFVVPPLKLVGANEAGATDLYTEGIAVFFRNDKVNFTGPYVWPNNGNVAVKPGQSVTPGAYPSPWTNALPTGNFFAGQYEYFKNPANQTGAFTYLSGNYRRPFFTTFTEVGTNRVIKLLSVHPSPGSKNNVKTVVNNLASIVEIQPSGSPQVVVVAGDFNINVIETFNFFTGKTKGGGASQGYYSLKQIFTQKFTSSSRGTNGVTAIKQIKDATPASYLTALGIDNMFIRYDGGLVPPTNNPRIIDPVTGTDEYPSQMLLSIADINKYYSTTETQTEAFRGVMNYGHIAHFAGASDHLPLVMDI